MNTFNPTVKRHLKAAELHVYITHKKYVWRKSTKLLTDQLVITVVKVLVVVSRYGVLSVPELNSITQCVITLMAFVT